MSLFIASLNSGSNGNCYYVGNHEEAVLIDAGISCRETEKRMNRLGLSMGKVKAVFVSHEHSDHINGLNSICKKFACPVYITPATLQNSRLFIDQSRIIAFKANDPVTIGSLTITAFSKFHDADDPHSFIVSGSGITVGIFTDLGVVCPPLVHHFKQCHAAFLEANYDEEMLAKGGYPYFLKKRITGGLGHLSNSHALDLFTTHRPLFMSHLILSHLSKNNNCPVLVAEMFGKVAEQTTIVVASRYEETAVYEIASAPMAINVSSRKTMLNKQQPVSQMRLDF